MDAPTASPLTWPDGWNRTPPLRRRDTAFRSGGSRVTLAVARERLQDELDRLGATNAAHIEALRGMERWGVGSVEQAFAGYARLPSAVSAARPWWAILGFAEDQTVTRERAEAAFRDRMRAAHPDAGGSHEQAAALNAAIAEARQVLS